jgi:hypothetical protein
VVKITTSERIILLLRDILRIIALPSPAIEPENLPQYLQAIAEIIAFKYNIYKSNMGAK